MSYTDLRDFDAEYTAEIDGLHVEIQAAGGGTVGREYVGTWRYIVRDADGRELGRGQDMRTGTPHTHAWVARAVAEYFSPGV